MKTSLNQTRVLVLAVALTCFATSTHAAQTTARQPAQNATSAPTVSKSEQPSTAQPHFTYATIKALETFSQRRLTERDYESVKKAVQTLVLLDDQDPSRTAVMMLSESYGKYKKIYDRAFKALENQKNKNQLEEIREVMAHFDEDGNG